MSYQKDREEFIEIMTKEGVPLMKATQIMRYANRIQRLAAKACNEELTKRDERMDALAEARIRAYCEPHGIKPKFGGDPRGACVKLLLPSGKYNSFGGREDGFCVPTRGY